MPATKEQQAWVNLVLFDSAGQPGTLPEPAPQPGTDWGKAAPRGNATASMREALKAALQGLTGRVCAGVDVAALSNLTALGSEAAPNRPQPGATSKDRMTLTGLISDMNAKTLAQVDVSFYAKLSHFGEPPGSKPQQHATSKIREGLKTTLNRMFADTVASVDIARLKF